MGAEPLSPTPGEGAGEGAGARDIGLPEIPGYRIEETLGRGSTGVVYRATQLAVDRQVALKVLHPDLAGRTRAVRRLQREARTAARLAHPNIVSAIDMGQAGALWWYAMELVEGESLAERLKRVGRLTERESLRLFTPLVDALDHAFRQGVVHRDIKPANVLIDARGRARLADLGLAFREEDPLITNPGGTLGTPHYVSPEQARNPQAADTRSDIWSLGATLYHAVCGRPPFAGESVAEILSGVLYGRVTEPRELESGLSRGLSLVLRKCLSRDPARRYQAPRELLDDLDRLREKRQVSVRAANLDPVRAGRAWRARLPWLLGAAAALVAATWLGRGALFPASGPAGGPPQAAAEWPELEALDRLALQPDAQAAPALLRLAELGPPPTRYRERYLEVEERLLGRMREDQLGFVRRLGSELDRLLNQRDFEAAQELVSESVLAARARTELALDTEQVAQLKARARLGALRERVQIELETHVQELARRIDNFVEGALLPRVANDIRSGHWDSARAQLSVETGELLVVANVDVAGLPHASRIALESSLRAELDRRREQLDRQWIELDAALAAWLEEQAANLAADLEARRDVGAVGEALEERYRERLSVLRVVEGLPLVSDTAQSALARLRAELVELERRLVFEDARNWLELTRRSAQPLLRERRFAQVRELYERGAELDWLWPVRADVELELGSAALLEGLLERAAQGVIARDGESISLVVRSIEVRGRLAAGADPLALGFRLLPAGLGPVLLALRPPELPAETSRPFVLPPAALEGFAGLPDEPGTAREPSDRLARALLRLHEGDLEGATACLPIPPTGDDVLDALAQRLEAEVGRRDAELRAMRVGREREAGERLNLVVRAAEGARHPGEREHAARQIDELLERYGDVETVRLRAEELREHRARLVRPAEPPDEADFREAFAPDDLELADGQVRLGFEFVPSSARRWAAGGWRSGAAGWIAPGVRSLEDLLADVAWPRLVLQPPIDLQGPLEASFTFDQESPPRLLVVSVAGAHVVLRGAQAPGGARVGVAFGGSDAYRRLIREVESGGKGQSFAGLARGQRYTLRIALSGNRGKAIVTLTGRDLSDVERIEHEIARLEAPTPRGKPGAASLALRSLEPVRLLGAELRARAVPLY